MTKPGKSTRWVWIVIMVCASGFCMAEAQENGVMPGSGGTWWRGKDGYTYMMGWECPRDKPDWAFRKSDGSTISPFPGSTLVCFNSPYGGYAVAQIADYIKKNPSVNILFLDAVWWGVYGNGWCCCDHCKQAYRAKFGKQMPIADKLEWGKISPSDMKQAIEWRRDTLENIYRRIVTKAKAIRPALSVTIHGLTSWQIDSGNYFSRANCLRMSDVVYVENYNDEIFFTAWLRGVSRRPISTHTPYLADSWQIQPPIELYVGDVFKAVTSGLLAHGCSRPVTSVRGEGKNSQSILKLVDREVQEKQQYVQDASPIPYAAIIYSEAVKTYYRRDDPAKSPLPSLQGAFEVMQRLHRPVEFLGDMDLDLENLKKFAVVILPNTAILTQPQVTAIRQYVKEGGSILSTYETSLYDELGERKADFDLSDVFGLNYVGINANVPPGSCIAPRGGFLADLQDLLAPFQYKSLHVYLSVPFVTSEPTTGTTKAVYTLMTDFQKPQSSNIPAVHCNNFGKGKSAYISADLFKLYTLGPETNPNQDTKAFPFSRRGWITDLTGELFNWLAPNPPIKVEGSPLLGCTFFEQKAKGRLIVHLLNSSIARSGAVSSLDPAKIFIRKDFVIPRKVYSAWPERKELGTEDKGSYLEVSAPETRIHRIVVIER